jgi:hypothetical protein
MSVGLPERQASQPFTGVARQIEAVRGEAATQRGDDAGRQTHAHGTGQAAAAAQPLAGVLMAQRLLLRSAKVVGGRARTESRQDRTNEVAWPCRSRGEGFETCCLSTVCRTVHRDLEP